MPILEHGVLYCSVYIVHNIGCSKKTGPSYVFSHPDYNFMPMKLEF